MKINIKNLKKTYDKVVLDGIDLEIYNHNALAIIGKSGCGKSTLLRILSGIEFPDGGTININESSIDKETVKEFQTHIGIVFQQHNLFPHLSVLDNITLILEKTRGYTKEDAKAKAITLLTKLQLRDEINKKPNNISGGQAQRASIARALSTDPEIIFLDEPTAALDPILTGEVLDSILELKSIGKDFIFVTHEIDFVRKFADYFIFMDEGKIVEEGNISELNNPKTEKLQLFLKRVI